MNGATAMRLPIPSAQLEIASRAAKGDWRGVIEIATREAANDPVHQSAPFPWLGPPEIFGPLPAVNAVLADLDVCVGAPTIIAGFGYSMKTLSLQSLALAMAADRYVWDRFPVRPGKVAHVDGEQGRRLTCERYQRLGNGLGLDWQRDLGDRLQLVVMPEVKLDHPTALDAYAKALEGFNLAIFDSLRALAPTLDENSSEVRQALDVLGAVSEKTGCATAVIHHARKPQRDAPGGAKMGIRGSGAIFDAASSVLIFGGEKGKPVHVSHEKARTSGVPHADFQLVAEDVPNDEGDPRWGLRVVAQDPPEEQTPNQKFAALKQRILVAVANEELTSKNAIHRAVGGGKQQALEAIAELEEDKRIVVLGGRYRPGGRS